MSWKGIFDNRNDVYNFSLVIELFLIDLIFM